jgi:hypothetical protein
MSSIALRPEGELRSGILLEQRIVKKDLEEVVDSLGGRFRGSNILGPVAVANTNGLIDVDADPEPKGMLV